MSLVTVDPETEQRLFDAEVEQIEQWWQTPRQSKLQRQAKSYSASQVASLRSSLPVAYPSSAMASKLLALLQQHRALQTAELTFGMIDPLLASQMDGQQTVYVSGALCAFSAAECIGQDTSDYPWDTVPQAAERIFRSQQYHDRRQRQDRMRRPWAERQLMVSARDYYMPIVADGDMGFGTATATMKLTKRMVEAGVAMFHLDDLALAGKRFTGAASHTVVSTGEYLQRLAAARLQLDIMGAETLIMCRCDVDGARFITSDHDTRDQAYIVGATVPGEPFAARPRDAASAAAWEVQARLMTFDEAVQSAASPAQLASYAQRLAAHPQCDLAERRQLARAALDGQELFFDWDLARTCDGRYRFAPTMQALLDRTLEAAHLGEVTWARMADLDLARQADFHSRFEAAYGGPRLFAAGYSATYDFAAHGYSKAALADLHRTLARMGIVWQVQPGFAMQGLNWATRAFSRTWAEEGMGGYVRDVQEPAMAADADGYEKMEWSGGYLVDQYGEML